MGLLLLPFQSASPDPYAESGKEKEDEAGTEEVDVVNGEDPTRREEPNDSGIEDGEEPQTEETGCD
jgi:hypothetical protein